MSTSCHESKTSNLQPLDILKFCWNKEIFLCIASQWYRCQHGYGWLYTICWWKWDELPSTSRVVIKFQLYAMHPEAIKDYVCNFEHFIFEIWECDFLHTQHLYATSNCKDVILRGVFSPNNSYFSNEYPSHLTSIFRIKSSSHFPINNVSLKGWLVQCLIKQELHDLGGHNIT